MWMWKRKRKKSKKGDRWGEGNQTVSSNKVGANKNNSCRDNSAFVQPTCSLATESSFSRAATVVVLWLERHSAASLTEMTMEKK